jgi:hypothetical protein
MAVVKRARDDVSWMRASVEDRHFSLHLAYHTGDRWIEYSPLMRVFVEAKSEGDGRMR